MSKSELVPVLNTLCYKLLFDACRHRYGYKTIKEVNNRYEESHTYRHNSYKANETLNLTPLHKVRSGQKSPTELMRKKFQNDFVQAAYWCEMPIREIFQGKLDEDEIYLLLKKSPSRFRTRFFKINPITNKVERHIGIKFESYARDLVIDGTYDALNVMLLVMCLLEKYCYSYHDVHIKKHYLESVCVLLSNICSKTLFLIEYDFMFNAIRKRFFYNWAINDKSAIMVEYNTKHNIFNTPPDYKSNYILDLIEEKYYLIEMLSSRIILNYPDKKISNALFYEFRNFDYYEKECILDELDNKDNIDSEHMPYTAELLEKALGLDIDKFGYFN